MAKILIDPETAVHPLRLTMTDEDWARLNRIFTEKSDEPFAQDEIVAYMDWLHDKISVRKQTHHSITTLQ